MGQVEPISCNNIDIELNIHDAEKPSSYIPKYFSGGRSMNFNENEYFVGSENYFDYVVNGAFSNDLIKIDVFIKQKSLNYKQKIKALKRAELSNLSSLIRSAILSYPLFWNIVHLALLKKESSFIHAAIIEKNDLATIFTGTGGAGKTSLCLELLRQSNIKYLSEDFGIIDSNGNAYFNPKAISLYRSDVVFGNPIAQLAIETLPKDTRKKWNLLTKIFDEDQIVKVLPKNVLTENRLSKNPKIKNVIYMIREKCSSLVLEDVELDEFAERITNVTMREIKVLLETLYLIAADAPKTLNYKDPSEIFQKTKNVYLKSFGHLRPKILHVPYKTSPDKIVDYLSKNNII